MTLSLDTSLFDKLTTDLSMIEPLCLLVDLIDLICEQGIDSG
jgi:hypothetical protein